VADGVRDHHVVPHLGGDLGGQQAQAVRLAKAVEAAYDGPLRVQLDDLVVTRVRDQHATVAQRDGLGGEAEVGGLDDRRDVRRVAGLQRPALSVLGAELAQERVDRVRVTLAGVLRDDVPLRVDQHQGRPGPGGVRLPGDQLGVVEHRVVHGVALDRRRQRHRVGLVHELRRVHPDHDQLVGVLLLHRAQLVEDVQAVHAAERPEVEEYEASAQVAQRERAVGVQPAAADQLGRADTGRSGVHAAQPAGSGETGPAVGHLCCRA
jgi:hypothetical protein